MKNKSTFSLFIGLVLALLSIQTQAQVVMYGETSWGGTYNGGTIFSVTPTGNISIISNLNKIFAAQPEGSLLYASDGNFYASSFEGGYGDSCTIFRCTPNGALKTMIDLDTVWGNAVPYGNNLIQALDGNLYGMIPDGGTYGYGVIFKLELSGYYTAIHFFSDPSGATPYGSLIQTSDSMLWGLTGWGGLYSKGTIFKCTTSGVYNSVYSFNTLDGIEPSQDLVLANDGNFYGMTAMGGKYGYGTLFQYNPIGGFTKLVDFDSINGSTPVGSLIQASDNNLYGLTSKGGTKGNYGTLFSCTLYGNLTTLVSFNDSDGAMPNGSLFQATDGYLYGTTNTGGKNHLGTIFQCSISGSLKKLVDFDSAIGVNPNGNLIEVDSLIPTALNKVSKTNYSSIFPNPNNGQFSVTCHSQSPAIMNVYNVLGEKVFTETLQAAQNGNHVDISYEPNGVYLYRIMGISGNLIGEGKLIIQK